MLCTREASQELSGWGLVTWTPFVEHVPELPIPDFQKESKCSAINHYYLHKQFRTVKWKSLSHVWLFATPWSIQSMEFSRLEYWNAYSLSLLQEFFPTQGSNAGLPHCRLILYQLSNKGSPRILKWVAYPFSRGSSQPRNRTGVSCIAGEFFTNYQGSLEH